MPSYPAVKRNGLSASPETQTLKPCRKCGESDFDWWDGRGTQAHLYCDNCGLGEDIQVCDVFDYGDERRHAPLHPKTLMNRQDIIDIVNAELIDEWNTRATGPALTEALAIIEKQRETIVQLKDQAEEADAWVREIKQIVSVQADDDALWFMTRNITEAYLQQELRRLHVAIEGVSEGDCAKLATQALALTDGGE